MGTYGRFSMWAGLMAIMKRDAFRTVVGRHSLTTQMAVAVLATLSLIALHGNRFAPTATAQPPDEVAPRVGHLVRVPLPITGNIDKIAERNTRTLLDNIKQSDTEQTPIVILEFQAVASKAEVENEFGRAYQLAQFLTGAELTGVRTIAYVSETLTGHALLPVMACEEIVMHPDAELGLVSAAGSTATEVVRNAYTEITQRRQTIPAAIALGLVDPSVEVTQVRTAGGTRYLLADELERITEDGTVIVEQTMLVPKGQTGQFTAAELLEDNFISHLAVDRGELADVLGLSSITHDASLGGAWHAIQIDLTGLITARQVERVRRAIDDKLSEGKTNLIILRIDSVGGFAADVSELASHLNNLDETAVHTVAFIDGECRGTAPVVAFACDEVIVNEDAVIGGDGAIVISEDDAIDLRDQMIQIGHRKAKRWSLWAAMVDPSLVVNRYTNEQTRKKAFFCEDELDELRNKADWQEDGDGEMVSAQAVFQTDGAEAITLELARHKASTLDDVQEIFALESPPEQVRANWSDELIDALASDQMAWFLLVLGGFAMYAEISSPGIGIGGFLASVCFILFFWSHFLNDTAGWLEVLLFVGGGVFILLEIFVLPGFGIFGLGGAIMIFASLVLASQTFIIPGNSYQMRQLPRSLMIVVGAGIGILVAMGLLRRYIRYAPIIGGMVLLPPEGEQLEEILHSEEMSHFAHLLGQYGVVTTRLAPAGKARFGDQLVDVTSVDEFVDAGSTVCVTRVRGSIVEIKATEPTDFDAADSRTNR